MSETIEVERTGGPGHAPVGLRVLLAEDSPVLQDLIVLALDSHGHAVDAVGSGTLARDALSAGTYDVALLDYHLPGLDGASVAAEIRGSSHKSVPRLIAITGDVAGLKGSGRAVGLFDAVLAKPLDMEALVACVEGGAVPASDHAITEMAAAMEVRADAIAGLATLHWPHDFDSRGRLSEAHRAGIASFDAIVVDARADVRDLSALWTTRGAHLLPVIDRHGSIAAHVDLDISDPGAGGPERAVTLAGMFGRRRDTLHPDLLDSDDVGEKLIGRMFVCGGSLTPDYDPRSSALASYDTVLDFRSIEKELHDLEARGLVSRTHFDRFHRCPDCASSQLNVREECCDCGSAALSLEPRMLHQACGFSGSRSAFLQGGTLACPHCRRMVEAGQMVVEDAYHCNGCKASSTHPQVGFVCVACGTRHDGEGMPTRDVFAWHLTEEGRLFASHGRVAGGVSRGVLGVSELPLDMVAAVNRALTEHRSSGQDFTLIAVAYDNRETLELAAFAQARRQTVGLLRQALGADDRVTSGRVNDFALVRNTPAAQSRRLGDGLREALAAQVQCDLGLRISMFGADELA